MERQPFWNNSNLITNENNLYSNNTYYLRAELEITSLLLKKLVTRKEYFHFWIKIFSFLT